MIRRLLPRSAVGLMAAATVVLVGAGPAQAYGRATWQVTFNGTAVQPGVGGFGFWGWCDFAGGLTSGNSADCEYAQYLHAPGGNLTCHDSLDITSWAISRTNDDFLVTGTATIKPAAVADACLTYPLFPNSFSFTDADTEIPAFLPSGGHATLGQLLGGVGEFNITETVVH